MPSPSRPGADASSETIIARLRANGGRVTGSRRATIEALASADHRHMSADEIVAEVRVGLPDVAPSTIYRTLSALEDLGIVTHVHLGHGPSTYHLTDQTHRHLVCRGCHTVIEIPDFELTELNRRLREAYGFSIAEEHFALIGDCERCRSARTRPDR